MKPVFAYDLTLNKKNEEYNGQEFIVARPSFATTHSMDADAEDAVEIVEKGKLSLLFRIIQFVCGAIALLGGCGIAKAMTGSDSVTLEEAYGNAAGLFWAVGISFVVWGVLNLLSKRKAKAVLESEDAQELLEQIDKNYDLAYKEMGVPEDTSEAETLSFFYKIKNGKIKVCTRGLQLHTHINSVMDIFSDEENLYFANGEAKFAFPLSSLKRIVKQKQHISVPNWYKKELPTNEKYKKYKLAVDNYGMTHMRHLYVLEIERGGELWGIYFPPYELDAYERLTNLKAEE